MLGILRADFDLCLTLGLFVSPAYTDCGPDEEQEIIDLTPLTEVPPQVQTRRQRRAKKKAPYVCTRFRDKSWSARKRNPKSHTGMFRKTKFLRTRKGCRSRHQL
jgi:hypothetical protein